MHGHLGVFVVIQLHDLGYQRVQIHGLELGRGQAGVITELIDETLHGVHLIHDGFDRLGQNGLLRWCHFAGEFHFQPLGRQLDGRQRVLDFMRKSPRHLAPGLRALGRHDFGNVVKHQQAGIARQLGAAGNQRDHVTRRRRAPRQGRAQLKRMLPAVQPVLGALTQERIELALHVRGEFLQALNLAEAAAFICGERRAQDTGGTGIGRKNHASRVQHDNARSQVIQNGLQVGASRIDLLHAALHCFAGVG